KGEQPADADQVITLTEKLKGQFQHMDVEHQMVRAYLNELKTASDKDPEVLKLVDELNKHARMEEEILFPTALLIGKHLKLLKEKTP
ncbi:MAG TPA: hemerythrin domain-containing protein, partial [Chitinophagaceae bacterium]